eukprot:COSAG05_NODE_804_length_7211_cov_31.496766_3_plen_88_part_00
MPQSDRGGAELPALRLPQSHPRLVEIPTDRACAGRVAVEAKAAAAAEELLKVDIIERLVNVPGGCDGIQNSRIQRHSSPRDLGENVA